MQGSSETEAQVPLTRRQHVILELVLTERNYLRALEMLSSLRHLVKEQALLDEDVLDEVFGNVDSLAAFHQSFLEQLEHINTRPKHEQNWGYAFSSFERATDLYVSYIASHRIHADAAIRERRKIEMAQGPPEVLQQVMDKAMAVGAFSRPLSRLAKYPCLLRDLHDKCDLDEDKKADLKISIDLLEWILKLANDAFDENQREQALKDLVARALDWKGHRWTRFGKLLLFDTFSVCQRVPSRPIRRSFKVYLFESVLLFCKVKVDKTVIYPPLQVKGWIYLTNIVAIETPAINLPIFDLELSWSSVGTGTIRETLIQFPAKELMGRWVNQLRTAQNLAMRGEPSSELDSLFDGQV